MDMKDVPMPGFVEDIVKPKLTPEQEAKVEATRKELAEQGALETRTQEEIVNDMVKAEEEAAMKRAEQLSPADMSSQFFMQFWPMYRQRVATLSNKDARRVLEAIVQWPLEDETPKFNSQAAKEAFSLGTRLIDAKTIMRDTVELEMMQKNLEKKEQFEKGENTNG